MHVVLFLQKPGIFYVLLPRSEINVGRFTLILFPLLSNFLSYKSWVVTRGI